VQLHQLRYVVEVADQRRFTRAAAALHVAQPSVSTAVQALERELGAPMFHRTRGEVILTAAGEAFVPWARQVLADCEAGREAVRDLAGLRRGRLALGATPSLTTNVLPGALAAFHRRHPTIELALHEAGSRDLMDRLEQGQLDVALVILPVKQSWVSTTALIDEELVLAVHPGHRLAGRESVSIGDLRDLPLVMFRDGYDLREVTLGACRQAGFEPTFAVEGLEMDGVLAVTAAGLGAAVVPASAVSCSGLPPTSDAGAGRGALRAVRFRDAVLVRTIGVASRRDRALPRAAVAFIDELRAHLSAPGSGLGPQ
jgi:DNA-binding transcriptional LysR family regulator